MPEQSSQSSEKAKRVSKKRVYKQRLPAIRARNPRLYDYHQKMSKIVHIEDCTQGYIYSLVDPVNSPPSCIPAGFPLASQKVKSYARGTLSLGTSGVGYIKLQPTTTSDTNAVEFTTAASVGTVTTNLSLFTNTSFATIAKNPYTQADFTAGTIQARMVAVCIRVRYIGRADSMSGIVMSVETPDREDMDGLSYTTLGNFENAIHERPNGQWHSVCYSGPVTPADVEFLNSTTPFGANHIMGFCINGLASDQYEWEVWEQIEYIGSQAVGKTQNKADIEGYCKVLQAVKGEAATKVLTPEAAPSLFNRFVDGVIEASPALIQAGQEMLGVMSLDPSSILRTALKGMTSYINPFQIQGGNTQGMGSINFSSGPSTGGLRLGY